MKKHHVILIALLTLSASVFAEDTLLDLLGKERTDATGKSEQAQTKKLTGVYFSAHWCPPCRSFTPILIKTYNQAQKDGLEFDIVFVSADRSKEDMLTYMKETDMPWLAVPYKSDASQAASQFKRNTLGSGGIPFLVILNADGDVITKEGRTDVTNLGVDAIKKWNAMTP